MTLFLKVKGFDKTCRNMFCSFIFCIFYNETISSLLPFPSCYMSVELRITGKGVLNWKAGFELKTLIMILFIVRINSSKKFPFRG